METDLGFGSHAGYVVPRAQRTALRNNCAEQIVLETEQLFSISGAKRLSASPRAKSERLMAVFLHLYSVYRRL
jgi:hypothetical protein